MGLSCCDRLTFPSMMSSGFICAVAHVRISFLLGLNNIPLYAQTTSCLSIHPGVDTWSLLFHCSPKELQAPRKGPSSWAFGVPVGMPRRGALMVGSPM